MTLPSREPHGTLADTGRLAASARLAFVSQFSWQVRPTPRNTRAKGSSSIASLFNRIFKTRLAFLIGGGFDSRVDLQVPCRGCPHRLCLWQRPSGVSVMNTFFYDCNGLGEATGTHCGLPAYISTAQEQAGFQAS